MFADNHRILIWTVARLFVVVETILLVVFVLAGELARLSHVAYAAFVGYQVLRLLTEWQNNFHVAHRVQMPPRWGWLAPIA